jgi:hypothetical protein
MSDGYRGEAQHLHDYRVNKTRGKQVTRILRTCLYCGRDATPRYAYCCDEHSELSRAETVAKLKAANRD